ncbi:MAG: nucleotidyl transferase AbiEii/AbiGii toxin family protein [Candidatus Aminicenantales bacterium]
MRTYTARQCVELFHLLFLNQLSRKLDKKCYALKGGANMRFFFKSPRYSDDIDFDLQAVRVEALRKKVDDLLHSKPFQDILQTRNIQIEHVTSHKQTETTQRWKLGLACPLVKQTLPIKIEFSHRRRFGNTVRSEFIASEIVRMYEMPLLLVTHYSAESAFKQKIDAIISRSETQARDIFDVYLLLTSQLEKIPNLKRHTVDLNQARENILSTSFAAFKSQVLSYLELDIQKQYNSADGWDDIRLKVVEALERTMR